VVPAVKAAALTRPASGAQFTVGFVRMSRQASPGCCCRKLLGRVESDFDVSILPGFGGEDALAALPDRADATGVHPFVNHVLPDRAGATL
jgi:hypothetical protein